MHDASVKEKSPETDKTQPPLRYRATRAALVSGTAQIVTRVLTVVLSVATARALEPREVGILGLAVILVGVISMIGYYPETAAVAARGGEDHEKHALAAVGIRAVVLAVLLVFLTFAFPPMAHYLIGTESGSDPLRLLLTVLVWMPILELTAGYPRVLLQRRLDLNYISAAGILQPLLFVGLAVILLWKGFGYLGVAWANIVGTAAAAVFLWGRLIFRGLVKWCGWPSSSVWRENLFGTARVFVGGFGGFLGERLDNLLVAGAIGPTALSFYSMAWNGARTPANVFGSTIAFVLVPTLARIQDEPARVCLAIRESLRHSYLLLAPVCTILFVSAPLLVTYILGAKWLPLVPCLRVMCFTVLAIPILHACNALLVGAGRAQLTGIATAVHLLALAAAIPLLARSWGILGAAVGDMISIAGLATTLCVTVRVAMPRITLKFISILVVPVIAAVLAGVLSWRIGALVGDSIGRLASEFGLVLIGYVLFVFLLGGRTRLYDLLGLLRGASSRAAVAHRLNLV
jgi:PST family polysaccharide transporter